MQASSVLERIRSYAVPAGVFEGRRTWLRQEGEMRFAPEKPWLPFTAEQWFIGNGIDFCWEARVRMAPLLRAQVVDSFQDGRGSLVARILGFITVARSQGPETDTGEAIRGLAELPWHPFMFREAPNLRWEISAAGQLTARFDDGDTRVTVLFQVDNEGRVLGGSAPKRPRGFGKNLVESPWSGVFGEYRTFEGLRVPTIAEAGWDLPEGRFVYWRGRVVAFRVLSD